MFWISWPRRSLPGYRTGHLSFRYVIKGENVGLLLALILLLVLFGIVGGVAISKFLFLILVVAAAIALIGFLTRTA